MYQKNITKEKGIRRVSLITYSGLLSPKVTFGVLVMLFFVVCSLRSFLIPVLTHSESNNCFVSSVKQFSNQTLINV